MAHSPPSPPPPWSQSAGIVFDGYACKPPPSYEECMSTHPIEPPLPPPQSPRPGDGLLGAMHPDQSPIFGPTKTSAIFGNWACKNKSTICGVMGAVTIFSIFVVLAYIIISTANERFTREQNRMSDSNILNRGSHTYDRMVEYQSKPQMTYHVPDISFPRVDPSQIEDLRKQLKNLNMNSKFLSIFGSVENNSKDKKDDAKIQQSVFASNNDATTDPDTYSSEDDDQEIEDVQQQLKDWDLNPLFLNLFGNKTDNKQKSDINEEITTASKDNINSAETNLNIIKTGE